MIDDPKRRPFSDYVDQPDTEARKRLAVQSIPFALPPEQTKKVPEPVIDKAGAHF
jgi:hypothetical protein